MNWDRYFIEECRRIAGESQHPRVKIGCLIVRGLAEIVSSGYNRLPPRVRDLPERYERSVSHDFVEHAERDAIYRAVRKGVCLDGTRIYCLWSPCTDCARGIIGAGISEVIVDPGFVPPSDLAEKWRHSQLISGLMFAESGVIARQGDI